jgi:predicted ATPase/class 3 adenylate cyclase
MSADLPTGTLTFLFSDVEGSTRLWDQEPDAMRVALARHDVMLREQIEAKGGQIVKTTGDGLHAVFERATQGAAVALACQQALHAQAWSELSRPLLVRMGLHTGEADLRQGDYYGTAVNRAARLMAIAAGGQILLSTITAELVRADLPQGAALRDLGEQRLKDLSRPERVFQLTGPGLPDEFPPLRSLNSLPNNLPLQLTSFVGRERQIAETSRLLGTSRLLTLIGPGGTGKTRLSLQVAAEVMEDFPAGAWWVELAPLTDPELVTQAVASVLGVRDQPDRPLLESLIDYLRAKTLLLILDNCEHLVEASAALAASLLGSCPRLKILASTREALGVAGETTYQVPSLTLPADHKLSPDALMQSEAVCLFVARAQATQPGFELAGHNLQAVAKICQRLDGIPLALELAARRVRLFSVEQIAARLDDRFRLLTGGSRTALPRQQTLRALIDWSYDLLDELEKAAFRQLSVFAGGWTFEAAESVLGLEALDLLTQLVDKSLVVADEASASVETGASDKTGTPVPPAWDGETRYHLLETIRQYGRDKLLESGQAPAVRDLHLQTYLQLAVQAEPQLEGPHMKSWLDRLAPEQDNFRAALEWGLDRDPRAALQIAASLRLFWQVRGGLQEGRHWLEQSLECVEALKPQQDDDLRLWQTLRAHGLLAAGSFAFFQGELVTARSLLEESIALARAAGENRILSNALGFLGLVTVWLGDTETAEALVTEGLKLSQPTDNPSDWTNLQAIQINSSALVYIDKERSAEFFRGIIQLQRSGQGNPWLLGLLFLSMGRVSVSQGDDRAAVSHYERAESLFRQIEAQTMVCAIQSERGHLERQAGNYTRALELYAITIPCWLERGGMAALAHDLECTAFIAVEQRQSERAASLLGAAEALREQANTPMRTTERSEYEACVSTLRNQLDETALVEVWQAGRNMMVEQAVERALEGIS